MSERRCARCGVPRSNRDKSYCQPCRADYARAYYRRNSAVHIARARRNSIRYRAESAGIVRRWKAQPCYDCGHRYPHYVMDADHVSGTKVGNVSEMSSRGHSPKRVREELEKCEPVCANCHRKRTWRRLRARERER